MEQIKSLAFCLCVAVLLFSILGKMLPQNGIERFAKNILNFLFIVLIFSGLHQFVRSGIIQEVPEYSYCSEDTETALKSQICDYISQLLKDKGVAAECTKVILRTDGSGYAIEILYLKGGAASSAAVQEAVKKITGVEKIYVE